MAASPPRSQFTLRQMLVAIAVVAALLGLSVPWIRSAREESLRRHCRNNLRQLALGVQNHQDQRGDCPPLAMFSGGVSWAGLILPYMESGSVFPNLALDQRYDAPPNNAPAALMGDSAAYHYLTCPTRRPESPLTNDYPAGDYAVPSLGAVNADDPAIDDSWMQAHALDKNWGPFLALHRAQPQAWINAPDARRYRSQTSFVMWVDGAAHQIVFGEKAMEPRGMGTAGKGGDFTVYAWIEQDYNASGCARNGANSLARYSSGAAGSAWNRFGSWHPNICQFAFGDGRVEPLQNNIRRQELEKLCNRANGGPCIQIGTVSIGRGYNCDVGRTSF